MRCRGPDRRGSKRTEATGSASALVGNSSAASDTPAQRSSTCTAAAASASERRPKNWRRSVAEVAGCAVFEGTMSRAPLRDASKPASSTASTTASSFTTALPSVSTSALWVSRETETLRTPDRLLSECSTAAEQAPQVMPLTRSSSRRRDAMDTEFASRQRQPNFRFQWRLSLLICAGKRQCFLSAGHGERVCTRVAPRARAGGRVITPEKGGSCRRPCELERSSGRRARAARCAHLERSVAR